MPRAQQIAPISQNRLLAVIPSEELARLVPHLQRVTLVFKETLFEAGVRIEFFYFPLNGAIGMFASTENGRSVGVGIVGNEGAADVSVVEGTGDSDPLRQDALDRAHRHVIRRKRNTQAW